MKRIQRDDVADLIAYERVRDEMRGRVIELKRGRRVSVGESITLLFENRDTVLLQIQEMIRTERVVLEDKIQDEIDAYNALIPDSGELSATLFIELPDLHLLTQQEVHRAVNRFQGIDRDTVWLRTGRTSIAARFEEAQSNEEKLAAVHYVRFALDDEAHACLADLAQPACITIDHPRYQAEAPIPSALREDLVSEL